NPLGDDVGQLQPIPSDLQIWVDAMGGKKKGRVAGLGSFRSSIKTTFTSNAQCIGTMSEEGLESIVRSQANLQNQLEKEGNKKEEIRKDLDETKSKLNMLIEKLGMTHSSSHLQQGRSDESESSDSEYNEDGSDDEVEDEEHA
ncbi:hypothetical protein PIB30_083322, partial [Stylosanthes scabra]|nr:hypothetical protein [Stylosanthes scabra]